MTAWTEKEFQEFDEYYNKLKTYKAISNEELIKIFKDENTEDRDWAFEALRDKKELKLPNLFIEQIQTTKDIEWKFSVIENSYVKFEDKLRPIFRELLLQNLKELENHFDGKFRDYKERSREEWHICTLLMRYTYFIQNNEVYLLDEICTYLEKSNVNQKIHVYRPLHYCLFEGISEKILNLIIKDCKHYVDKLPSSSNENEEIREKKVCFTYAMGVLYLNDHDEFQKNCKIMEKRDYGWLAEYLTRNTKRFIEEQKNASSNT